MHRLGRQISTLQLRIVTAICVGVHLASPAASTVSAVPINLEFQPSFQVVHEGQVVDIDLIARTDPGVQGSIAAAEIALTWDPMFLTLLGHKDSCTELPCPPNTFDWANSDFPDDTEAEGLNVSFDDGDALLRLFASLDLHDQAPVTNDGLWMTTLHFEARHVGDVSLSMAGCCDIIVSTMVIGGSPIADVTGALSPGVSVSIDDPCLSPAVEAIGSRYVAITPVARRRPVALRVRGDIDDVRVRCLARYLQPDGSLDLGAAFLTPAEWGTVWLTGRDIVPAATYTIHSVCDDENQTTRVSPTIQVTTWLWGDTDGTGDTTISDVLRVIDGADGSLGEGVIIPNIDLKPCRPDGVVDDMDIQAAGGALKGTVYPCQSPCAPGVNLDDYVEFLRCFTGPIDAPPGDCSEFDVDASRRIDLRDYQLFQRNFDGL